MTSVEAAIMTRLTGDSVLVSLLGGSGRIYHALEGNAPKVGSLTFMETTSIPALLDARNVQVQETYYMLTVFHDQYQDVLDRVYRLLHLYQFPTPSDAGISRVVWDWSGPDGFDEDLKVGRKQVRYKFYVARKAQAPI